METGEIQRIVSECVSLRQSRMTRVWLKRHMGLSVADAEVFFHECVKQGYIDNNGKVLSLGDVDRSVPAPPAGHPSSTGAATSSSGVSPPESTMSRRKTNVQSAVHSDPPPSRSGELANGVREIQIVDISLDQEVQPRCQGVRQQVVKDYAEKMELGVVFPPVVVFRGERGLLVGDGFHRVEAAKRAGRTSIRADVRVGELREAVLFALQANLTHGAPLTQREKRAAAERLLRDPEWGRWSGEEIARRSGASPSSVSRLKRKIDSATDRVRTSKCRIKDGRIKTMKTGNIGRKRRARPEGRNPDLAEILTLAVDALNRLLSWGDRAALAAADSQMLQELGGKLTAALDLIPNSPLAIAKAA